MIALDTNVLVRAIIDDDESPAQCKLARHFVASAKQVFISQIVQVELFWVLKQKYKITKSEIVAILENLSKHSKVSLENPHLFQSALTYYRDYNADFADLLIVSTAQIYGYPVWTFDKNFSKTGLANLLQNDSFSF